MARRPYSLIRGDTYQPLSSSIIINVAGGDGSAADSAWNATTDVEVGDFIFISGPEEIDRANSTSRATLPAIAIVVTKPTDTTATIRYANEYTFVGRDPLIPGALYYVSDTEPGKIFTPSEIETMPPFLQQVGRAKSEEILVLMIGAPFSFQSQ